MAAVCAKHVTVFACAALPRDLVGPAAEHARVKAIGESDVMPLKFVKPTAAHE